MRWGLFSWANVADDYVLNYKLQPKVKSLAELLSLLNQVNKITVNAGDLIFDGTLSSLFYLINKGKLDLNKISDERLKQAINETISEMKNGTLPKISKNRWSRIALISKTNFVGLHLYTGILKITKNCEKAIECFEKLREIDFPIFDEDIDYLPEESIGRHTIINSMWVSLASLKPWNKRFNQTLNQFFVNEFLLSYDRNTPIGKVFSLLQPHIDIIANKYFPEFHKKDHIACTAVRQAAVFVVFNSLNILKNKDKNPSIKIDGMFYQWIRYIYDDKGLLKEWFINYVRKEMEPRIEFIKYLAEKNIFFEFSEEEVRFFEPLFIDKSRVKRSLYYLPIFESFRFANPILLPLYKRIIVIFHDKSIKNDIKNLLIKKIILNIQRLSTYKMPQPKTYKDNRFDLSILYQEKEMKENLFILLFEIMKPLIKKIYGRIETLEDVKGIVDDQFYLTILKYDSNRNPNFFGYISSVLHLNVKSDIREKKINYESVKLNDDIFIPDNNLNIEQKLIDDYVKKRFYDCVGSLPDKEKMAILKSLRANEKLSPAERKAKSRAFKKLKEMSELSLLLS